uniref:Pleckstrin homology and RhoGEF domain containing G4B n=1 Tax=Electrophorus electricus TaxID=8005 RepID=A0A4W4FCR6_ELEEL
SQPWSLGSVGGQGYDTESLDSCIQSTLSVLYAPFGATAATVLWQLFSVVERQYRGDGLRCFLDFLLPAKRILHTIQRETCLRYQGLLLYHDGWPLCIHEKVVLQLAPLHKVRLRQGDFYLQVVPLGRKAAKLVLKCLSGSGHAVAEIPVPESMYGSVFTADFLQNVTRERKLQPLQNCLLSTGAAVYRTPWRNVVNPVLASRAGSGTMQPRQLGVCGGSLRGQLATCSDRGSTGTLDSRRSSRESLGSLGGESTASAPPLGRSPALAPMSDPEKGPARGSGGSRCLSFSTDLSNPTPRRRHPRDSATFETRRLFRKSYMEALQNPMNLGSSSESILETGGRKAGGGEAGGKPRARSGSEVRPTQRESLQQRFSIEVKGLAQGPNSVFMCACVFVCVCAWVLMHLSACVCVRACMCTFACVYAHACLYVNIECVCECMCVCMCICLCVCACICVWVFVCVRAYLHASVHVCARVLPLPVIRKEKMDLGLTVLVDTRRQQASPALFSALAQLKVKMPTQTHLCATCEVLSSLKALQKYVDSSQLTSDLDGTFSYSHGHFVQFRQKMEQFSSSCTSAISSLRRSIDVLNTDPVCGPQEVEEMISQQKKLMRSVLEDSHLNCLRLEGGTFLARARKEEACEIESYRDAVDMACALYNQMDEEVHKLVILSNKSLQQLENLLELRTVQEESERADQWVAHCQDYFQHVCLTESGAKLSPEVLQILREYHSEATKFSLENFSSLNETVATLGSPRELQQWNLVWMKCQSTRRQLEEALVGEPEAEPDSDTTPPCPRGPPEPVPRLTLALDLEDGKPRSAGPFSEGDSPFLSSHFPFLPEGDELSPSLFDDTDSDCTVDSSYSCRSEPTCSPAARHRRPPLKKIMKKTVSYELAPRDRGHSDTSHNSYTGVYIKGLEVTNNVCVEKKLQRSDVKSPPLIRSTCLSSSSPSSSPRVHCRITEVETKRQSSKIQHIMDEMISTEREYVRSLAYVIEHYYPEMERPDLPQDLRAKRSIIFGNLEKLCDFHGQYFLKDLEQCAHSPLSISGCFLRHEEQFGMYALYSKNKPRSDVLLSSHGNSFFKNKQVQLEDKMDLASYLLKPVQRMSKYALLLKDLIKECSQSQEQELTDLRTAEEMVKFQLRHGNDLLAMDAIRGCDVNLKEQGQLRCQDEFIVWCGRRKYPRRVFLFEDLILFSKTKKIEGGYDIYIYKQSFKTAEIGMTENVGDSGLRFEIWFRRRKSQDTFILQASSAENKAAWTTIIGKILWRQALRNRELRMQEMVSMGIGNKPYMDIKPSDAAISNRSINYIMKGTEPRSRSSVTVPTFDYSSPFKRPHSTISNSSTSSSGSQSSSSFLGSLNPHLHAVSTHPLPGCPALAHWAYDCIEEDELEQDTGIQPSMSEFLA